MSNGASRGGRVGRFDVTVKCGMGCGWKTTMEWSDKVDGYPGNPGQDPPKTGQVFEGPLTCPRCEDEGVAHSGMYVVTDVSGRAKA